MACGWLTNGHRVPVREKHQQGAGSVLLWAGIINNELVGPFQVEDRLKVNSQTHCQFLEDTFFKQWYRKKSATFKKAMIFMQDYAPLHTSSYTTAWLARKGIKDDRMMIWPPSSSGLNPTENFWVILKFGICNKGRQFASLNRIWEAVVAASAKTDHEQIKKMTDSMNGRLMAVIGKKGG